MKNHATRFRLISIGLLISVFIWLGLTIGGQWAPDLLESSIFSVSSTTTGFLLVAWLDALNVERRRRTPGTSAVEDDVSP